MKAGRLAAVSVEQVSWDDVQEFIGRLNAQAGGTRYRLPTEAEWEYATRSDRLSGCAPTFTAEFIAASLR